MLRLSLFPRRSLNIQWFSWLKGAKGEQTYEDENENEKEKGPREGNPEARGISQLESGVHPRLAISILYFEAGVSSGWSRRKKAELSHEVSPLLSCQSSLNIVSFGEFNSVVVI